MPFRISCSFTVAICAALLPSSAWSAEPTATIDGNGIATVRLVPAKIRIQMQVAAHGKTTELSVERLKARREALADKLGGLGAERQSVNFGDSSVSKLSPSQGTGNAVPPSYSSPGYYPPPPSYSTPPSSYAPVTPGYPPSLPPAALPHSSTGPYTTPVPSSSPSSNEAPSAPYVARRVQSSPELHGTAVPTRPRGEQQEFYVTVATLTIDYPLHVETVEQATLASEALRKKIETASILTREKAAEKLPADEQELLEELSGSSPILMRQTIQRPVVETGPNGQNAVRYVTEEVVSTTDGPSGMPTTVSPPTYLYVAAMSSTQRKALFAKAFGDAKSHAAELAEASGGKLGAISNLNGEVNRIGAIDNSTTPDAPTKNERDNEASHSLPEGLIYQAVVHATFKLE